MTAFWRDPAFAEFLPYIKATAAWDKRHGNSPRFDLKSSIPLPLLANALTFKGSCTNCGTKINVFRTRSTEAKRGSGGHAIYLAATCPLDVRIGCSRGKKVSVAYQEIWDLVKAAQPREGEQGGLL